MPVIIQWSEQCNEQENCYILVTPAGMLKVCQAGPVITKTHWIFESTDPSGVITRECEQLLVYLNKPANTLKVNLLKQGSEYRNKVWTGINNIPAGQVLSYRELAKQLGSGARAVANACRDNPFPGIIPCHRVVSVTGLGGYMGKSAGQPIEIKKQLLAIESVSDV